VSQNDNHEVSQNDNPWSVTKW